MPPAMIPQVPVLGPGLGAVAEASTSRHLNFELEEGKKGLGCSQLKPDGGPRTIIQNKGVITDPCSVDDITDPSVDDITDKSVTDDDDESPKGLNAVNVKVDYIQG